RRMRELMVLLQHAVRGGGVAEDPVISRAHEARLRWATARRAGEFLDHIEIRIGAPLADFVRDDRHVHAFDGALIIAAEPAALAAHAVRADTADGQKI